MAVSKKDREGFEERVDTSTERVTFRSVALGVMTIAGMTVYITYFGRNLVKSYLPVAVMIPFLGWVILNTVLKLTFPQKALSRTELLTVFAMCWVVGNLPAIGWAQYNVSSIAGLEFYASPENRLREQVIPVLPKWLFLDATEPPVLQLYTGLPPGDAVPWLLWVRPLFWWLVGSLAVVMAAYFVTVIFFTQWEAHERLVFPMATFPVDLLRESGESRLPAVFRDRLFWIGFACVAGIICWNIAGYFLLQMPRITLFDGARSKTISFGRNYPDYYFRVQPMIMGLAYLCPLDILFSFWTYNLLSVFLRGLLNQTGFSVGLRGQAASADELLMLEAHGALVFLVGWSIWVARGHLKATLQQAISGVGDGGAPVSYRTAWLGFLASGLCLGGWCLSVGFTFSAMLLQLVLMFICFFGVAKYAATTGFTFLNAPGRKGGDIILSLVGTRHLSPGTTAMMTLMNRHTFLGQPRRMAAAPAISHFFKIMGEGLKRSWRVAGVPPLAYVVGFFLATGVYIHLCYHEGGLNGMLSYLDISYLTRRVPLISEERETYFDYQKACVWLAGGAFAGALTYLRARFAWWPFYPAALAFPTSYNGFSLFLVWAAKSVVLRFWGVIGYRRSLPFWYGVIVGYLFGVGLSSVVDAIWFPGGGHFVHGW